MDEMKMDEMKKENIVDELKKLVDPDEQLARCTRGRLKLANPIQDGEKVIDELCWDFGALTGEEYADAMDRDAKAFNNFRLTNTQAFHLFCAAAAKGTPGVFPADIRKALGIMDTQKAVQVATVFFSASNRAGFKRILDA